MSTDATAASGGEHEGAPDDIRQQMKEALERKRAHEGEHLSAREAGSAAKVHEVHGPEGGRRQFRRKSGG
jgi:hypothetical protein